MKRCFWLRNTAASSPAPKITQNPPAQKKRLKNLGEIPGHRFKRRSSLSTASFQDLVQEALKAEPVHRSFNKPTVDTPIESAWQLIRGLFRTHLGKYHDALQVSWRRWQIRQRAWDQQQKIKSQMAENYRSSGSVKIPGLHLNESNAQRQLREAMEAQKRQRELQHEMHQELVQKQLPFYAAMALFSIGATAGIILAELFWVRPRRSRTAVHTASPVQMQK